MSKRSAIFLLVLAGLIAQLFFLPPARPFIQLAGEVYPGSQNWPIIGSLFGGWTNTASASVAAYGLVLGLGLLARRGLGKQVPSGLTNFFEFVVEAAYNFVEGVVGPKKVKDFFPWFMTFVPVVLAANWMGLLPGYDSVGLWEYKPAYELHGAEKDYNNEVSAYNDSYDEWEAMSDTDRREFPDKEPVLPVEPDWQQFVYDAEARNDGDVKDGIWLLRGDKYAEFEGKTSHAHIPHASVDKHHDELPEGHLHEVHLEIGKDVKVAELEGQAEEARDWTIVPFFRPASTDMNFTAALAIVSMLMVQYYGFKYVGAIKYPSKFFPFLHPAWRARKDAMKFMDIFVGLLELVGEFGKILSFTFRLMGSMFAGMVLLFVMAYLATPANFIFAGLEFFVGLIQAIVFGFLSIIFMNGATEDHHAHHGDDHH